MHLILNVSNPKYITKTIENLVIIQSFHVCKALYFFPFLIIIYSYTKLSLSMSLRHHCYFAPLCTIFFNLCQKVGILSFPQSLSCIENKAFTLQSGNTYPHKTIYVNGIYVRYTKIQNSNCS